MKMRLTHTWKKRLLGLAVLMIGLAILASGTAAQFTAEEKVYSVITSGLLQMELVEETAGNWPWQSQNKTEVLPGTSVERVVRVRNSGKVPFFCKLTVSGKVTASDGSELSFEPVSLDLNTEQWVERGGAYYYGRILYPGEVTEPLFTQVTFDPWMGNEYAGAKAELRVLAQAVQSDNNGTDPLEALGWSAPTWAVIDLTQGNPEAAPAEQ